MTLDEIYAAMAAANQPPGAIFIAVWAAVWAQGALLLLVGASASTHWFAALARGMNMADTFYTSGADANTIGILFSKIGRRTLAAGLFVGLSPEPFIVKKAEVSDA